MTNCPFCGEDRSYCTCNVEPPKLEHPPGHRCPSCRTLRAILSGATDEAFLREGFKKNAEGKWEDTEPKEKT